MVVVVSVVVVGGNCIVAAVAVAGLAIYSLENLSASG